jgi:SAM-dependent methyltransferase
LRNSEQAAVWGRHAGQWSRVGTPLKPSLEDGELTLAALQPVFDRHPERCRIAILGVTPELVQLPWPQTVVLQAYDHSAGMIAKVWQPNPVVASSVQQVDWCELPLDSAMLHAAVGDGSLNVLPHLGDYGGVLRELNRVLVPKGRVVIRCFIRPDVTETLDDVVSAIQAAKVGSFHALKWRFAMSLANVPGSSVAVSDIHRAIEDRFPSRGALAQATGWPEAVIDTIDAYRDSPTRYSFPTLTEMRERCLTYFDVESVTQGTYELADRCPTLTLMRRETGGW